MTQIDRNQFLKELSLLTGASVLSPQLFAMEPEWKKAQFKLDS